MGIVDNVRKALEASYPIPLSRKEAADKVNANFNTVCGALVRLTKRGEIENVQPGYYKYVPPSERL